MNCEVCGGATRPRLKDVVDPQSGERFAIESCVACGLGWTRPRPRDVSAYYGGEYYGTRHGFTARLRARWRLRRVENVTGPGAGRRILDVGCGEGTFLLAAREAGWRAAGTELSPDAARAAGLDVRASLDDCADLAPVSCVTMWHSLEHLTDPAGALARARGLLAQDGAILVAVPNSGGIQARAFRDKWLHLDVPRHLVHFEPPSLKRLMRRAGFRVLRRWDEEFEYDVLGWSQSLLNILFRTPNAWFDVLRGRPRRVGLAHWVVGLLASAAAVPLTAMGAMLGCGGTVVIAARAGGRP